MIPRKFVDFSPPGRAAAAPVRAAPRPRPARAAVKQEPVEPEATKPVAPVAPVAPVPEAPPEAREEPLSPCLRLEGAGKKNGLKAEVEARKPLKSREIGKKNDILMLRKGVEKIVRVHFDLQPAPG